VQLSETENSILSKIKGNYNVYGKGTALSVKSPLIIFSGFITLTFEFLTPNWYPTLSKIRKQLYSESPRRLAKQSCVWTHLSFSLHSFNYSPRPQCMLVESKLVTEATAWMPKAGFQLHCTEKRGGKGDDNASIVGLIPRLSHTGNYKSFMCWIQNE